MRTPHTPRPAWVLQQLGRVLKSQADSLDKVETVRAKQAHVAKVQLVGGFRS